MNRPWPPGSATGVGSLPGTDPGEAARLVFGELPDLPHLAELPERGAGAELVGRTASLLVDLPVEIVPSGWRLASHPGRDLRRARDFLARDLDALQSAGGGHGGALKVQLAGPWTLAATLELPSGHKVISDHGATRDLAESLSEGLRQHLTDVAGRAPSARVVVQLDEPSLPAVLDGRVATPSGYGTVRTVDAVVIEQTLTAVLDVAPSGSRVMHCCASDVPIAMLRAAGADAISLDASLVTTRQIDLLGEAVDGGTSLWLGVLPARDAETGFDEARTAIRRLWSMLGYAEDRLAESVVPTPACGLAGATPEYARRVLAVLRDLGRDLVDPVERSPDPG